MVSLISSAYLSTNNSILVVNKKGQTPLHLAAAAGHKDSAEALLFSVAGSSTHQNLLTARDDEGYTVFHAACNNGHLDVFCYLCRVYPQGIHVMDDKGRGLLHAACEGGNIEIVTELIERYGLDPESQNSEGMAEGPRSNEELFFQRGIKKLNMLTYHVNPVPADSSGHTYLHYVSRTGKIHKAHPIDTFSYTPDDPDYNGYISVHAACEAGNMELVHNFLTDLNFNTHAETYKLKTLQILYGASKSTRLELVLFLAEVFSFKLHPHDIEVAQLVDLDSEYLQEVYNEEDGRSRMESRGVKRESDSEENQDIKRIKLYEEDETV